MNTTTTTSTLPQKYGPSVPYIIFQRFNLVTFLSVFSPIVLIAIVISYSIFYQNAKGFVYLGFLLGISLTFYFSTNLKDIISIRIAVGSGTAFLIAQLLDVQVFDRLRRKAWFVAPLASSLLGSFVDTILFFFISFYKTGIPWLSLALGDFSVKILIALIMLIPFRLFLNRIKDSGSGHLKVT